MKKHFIYGISGVVIVLLGFGLYRANAQFHVGQVLGIFIVFVGVLFLGYAGYLLDKEQAEKEKQGGSNQEH